MFNRVARQQIVSAHNIQEYMSRSRKRTPACCWVGQSQKKGKRFCNRKFRRTERRFIGTGEYQRIPLRTIEVMNPYNLGGDGKGYKRGTPDEEWFVKLMRK